MRPRQESVCHLPVRLPISMRRINKPSPEGTAACLALLHGPCRLSSPVFVRRALLALVTGGEHGQGCSRFVSAARIRVLCLHGVGEAHLSPAHPTRPCLALTFLGSRISFSCRVQAIDTKRAGIRTGTQWGWGPPGQWELNL